MNCRAAHRPPCRAAAARVRWPRATLPVADHAGHEAAALSDPALLGVYTLREKTERIATIEARDDKAATERGATRAPPCGRRPSPMAATANTPPFFCRMLLRELHISRDLESYRNRIGVQ